MNIDSYCIGFADGHRDEPAPECLVADPDYMAGWCDGQERRILYLLDERTINKETLWN